MNEITFYKTIKNRARAELIEKKSRFIATVMPTTHEEEALALISELRKEFYDASHNVYAYIVSGSGAARYSDDGEPGGTAGLPVMEVLKKEGLTDVTVIVTRYFGGTLLGAGGLIRAYSKSAKMGLSAGGIVTMTRCRDITVNCPYDLFGRVKHMIQTGGYEMCDVTYGADVSIEVCVRYDIVDKFSAEVTEVTAGAAELYIGDERYCPIN